MDKHNAPLAVCPPGTRLSVSPSGQPGTQLCQSGSAICPSGSFTNNKKEELKEKSGGERFGLKSVAFLSQKGGAGKTTLSVHLAVAAQEAGERVTLIDTDPQGSATAWHATRQATQGPALKAIEATRLHDAIKSLGHDAMTLCVVDSAPHAGLGAVTIARNVDLVLIPVRPSAFDLAAAVIFRRRLHQLIGRNGCCAASS